MAEPREYIRDESDNDVSGIIVVETNENGVRVTENRDDVHWSAPFWMPRREFASVTHADSVSVVGRISKSKFDEVMSLAEPAEA